MFNLSLEKNNIFNVMCNIYKKGFNLNAFISMIDIKKIIDSNKRSFNIIQCVLYDKTYDLIVKEIKYCPIKNIPIHLDMQIINIDHPIKVKIPLIFEDNQLYNVNYIKHIDFIELIGNFTDLPLFIIIPLNKNKIFLNDLDIPKSLKINSKKNKLVIATQLKIRTNTTKEDTTTIKK